MALTPEEELELEQLQQVQGNLVSSLEDIKLQMSKEKEQAKTIQQPVEEEGLLSQIGKTLAPLKEPLKNYGKAFEKGAEQGLFSGGAEEVRAFFGSATGDQDYEKIKKQQEESFKKAEEEYPIPTFLGEAAGSIAQGAAITGLTSGLGAPVAITNALSKLQKASKLAQKLAKPAGLAARIAKTGAIGAAEAGAQAVLRSEKSLGEQAKEGFEGVGSALKSGAIVGGGLEGAGKLVKGVGGLGGKIITKKIEEGKFFPSARPILKAVEFGKKGIGFSSEESLQRPVQNLVKVIEEKVAPSIRNSLRDVKEVSNYLLENVQKDIDVDDVINSGVSKLRSEGNIDASRFADYISNKYKFLLKSLQPEDLVKDSLLPPVPVTRIPLAQAKLLVRDINNELKAKQNLSETFKNTISNMAKTIDSTIDSAVTDRDAAEAVLKDPEITLKYLRILNQASPTTLAEDILSKMDSNFKLKNPEDALKKAENLSKNAMDKSKKALNEVLSTLGEDKENQITEVTKILQDPRNKLILQEAIKNLGPIKILDGKMRNILNAQEILTGKSLPKTDVENAENVIDLLRVISGQTKEGISADISKIKYDKALNYLATAIPEVADRIEKEVRPAADDLFMVRYLHGLGFDPALKDTAIVQNLKLGGIAKTTAQAANIAAQITESAKKGVSGPILGVPTTTMLRPTVSAIRSLKNAIDYLGGGKEYKWISDRLQDALNAPDEGRRIAILNTLMSYESFRNLVKENNKPQD